MDDPLIVKIQLWCGRRRAEIIAPLVPETRAHRKSLNKLDQWCRGIRRENGCDFVKKASFSYIVKEDRFLRDLYEYATVNLAAGASIDWTDIAEEFNDEFAGTRYSRKGEPRTARLPSSLKKRIEHPPVKELKKNKTKARVSEQHDTDVQAGPADDEEMEKYPENADRDEDVRDAPVDDEETEDYPEGGPDEGEGENEEAGPSSTISLEALPQHTQTEHNLLSGTAPTKLTASARAEIEWGVRQQHT